MGFWRRLRWQVLTLQRCVPFWPLFVRDLLGAPQLGAVPGGGTEFVLFTSRLVFALAQVRQVAAGVLFADVKGLVR